MKTLTQRIEATAQSIMDRYFGKGATIDKSDWDFTTSALRNILASVIEEMIPEEKKTNTVDYEGVKMTFTTTANEGEAYGWNNCRAELLTKKKEILQ